MASQTRRSIRSASGRSVSSSAPASFPASGPASQTTAVKPSRRNRSHKPPKKNKKKHRILKWILGFIALCLAAGIGLFAYLYITTEVPNPENIALAEKTTVYYNDGKSEIGSFAEQNREIIDCSVLPDYVGNAIVASENRTFWSDSGIDLKGIGRALVNNVTKGTRQGGSTITQQYAERYYLGETTTYKGKIKEAFLALKIAQTQDKDTVLCNYMNTIYLGRNAYGIQAAAKSYFNKDAKDLTLSEAAMLAGIIPSPNNWDPAVSKASAQKRFNRVLNIMREDGYISAKDKSSAKLPDTVKQKTDNIYQGTKGYLLMMVRNELVNSKAFTTTDIDTGGYKIITTIDKSKQDLMYKTATPTDTSKGIPDGVQVGGISVNPKTGAIISIYGGEDYLKHQLNNATQATYEIGSTMKPFVLLSTVQKGVSLNTVFNGNSPRSFPGITTPMTNSGGVSYGYINLYQATANSVNTVYMDLAQHLGSQTIIDTAHTAGIKGTIANDAYTALGNSGLSVLDVSRGFATIANGGKKPTVHIVGKVTNSQNKDLYTGPTSSERVFDANDVALVTKAMEGVIQYGTGSEASSIGKTMAGKSGTANDAKAVSFVGFTPSTLTIFAMWNPGKDGSAQEMPTFSGYQYGMGFPAHLFTLYMSQALEGVEDEQFPEATDDGTVGGTDGTWGTGGGSSYSGGSSSGNSYQNEENQSGSDSENSSGTESGNGSSSTPSPSQSESTQTQEQQSQEQNQQQQEQQQEQNQQQQQQNQQQQGQQSQQQSNSQ
ncbi:penicillin-binding protein [Bifidobacterium sp. SMB2]|uniref:Penicillin-binding protein n=1 Tax=Bifidobacterium saimiriisciurei TaxID=2661627 RepID=A0ABX0CCD4_9BIFI|nr:MULTISPECIES: transglycosylase domain-containing protein [Bifidobacterium]NEG97092.1 penicillin-binding protein [Bifidobacterium sp. SMB2]NEH12132.1 penicillin-binding protein [Bifidobacterium saimiriisciurei]